MKTLLTFLLMSSMLLISDDHLGKWYMHQVLQNGEDVTQKHNPNQDRFIIFEADGTFESGGTPNGKNTGRYDYDKKNGILLIDSDAGPEDDSSWKVSINGDTLRMQGFGSEWAEAFELVHIKG